MPYRRTARRPRRTTATRRRTTNKRTRRIARTEAKKVVSKGHPVQYFDTAIALVQGATPTSYSMLSSLLANDQILDTTVAQSNAVRWIAPGASVQKTEYRKVHILGIYYRLRFTAAQSTALLTADLYNTMRFIMFWSDSSYADPVTQILNTPDGMLDTRDVARKYVDKTIPLMQMAFQSNGYNAPQTKFYKKFIKVNRVIECFSDQAGTNWNTKKGTLRTQFVSDSLAAPSPDVNGVIRIYFKFLD